MVGWCSMGTFNDPCSNKGHCPFSNPVGKSSGTRLRLLIGLGIRDGWNGSSVNYDQADSLVQIVIHRQKIHGYKNIYCYFNGSFKHHQTLSGSKAQQKKIKADPSACSGQSLWSRWSFPLESDPTRAICCDLCFLWVQDHPGDPDSTWQGNVWN